MTIFFVMSRVCEKIYLHVCEGVSMYTPYAPFCSSLKYFKLIICKRERNSILLKERYWDSEVTSGTNRPWRRKDTACLFVYKLDFHIFVLCKGVGVERFGVYGCTPAPINWSLRQGPLPLVITAILSCRLFLVSISPTQVYSNVYNKIYSALTVGADSVILPHLTAPDIWRREKAGEVGEGAQVWRAGA